VSVEADLPISARYLSPAYVAVVILACIVGSKVIFANTKGRPALARMLAVFAVGLALLHTARATRWTIEKYNDGVGISSRTWQTSKIIEKTRSLEASVPIYTNAPWAIRFLTGRQAIDIPHKSFLRSGLTNKGYLAELEAMQSDLEFRNGALVYFTTAIRHTQPSLDELKTYLPLQTELSADDGVIFRFKY
jgi:branched-subunit amino acid ABC-type transport system permease component